MLFRTGAVRKLGSVDKGDSHLDFHELEQRRGITIYAKQALVQAEGAELMRTRYCVRYELGLCPRQDPRERPDPLYLRNNGRRLCLGFDCARCEMTVSEA